MGDIKWREYEVYEKHYKSLVRCLPMERLHPTFVTKGLLSDIQLHQEITAATTDNKKAVLLLDSMRGGLLLGESVTFLTFVEALSEHAKDANDATVGKLVDNLNKDLFPLTGTTHPCLKIRAFCAMTSRDSNYALSVATPNNFSVTLPALRHIYTREGSPFPIVHFEIV